MISVNEIVDINKIFADGKIVNNSIYYAIGKKSVRDKISHILRALIVDHTFADGNKRTAFMVALLIFGRNHINVYKDTLLNTIVNIARNNITDINEINRMVGRCIKK